MPPLDPFSLFSQVAVLYGTAEPARVVTATQVEHPRFFVDSLCHLGKNHKVLGLEIVAVPRPTKEEAVVPHVAFGVFAMMSNSLRRSGNDFNRERRLSLLGEPDDGFPLLVCQSIGQIYRPTNRRRRNFWIVFSGSGPTAMTMSTSESTIGGKWSGCTVTSTVSPKFWGRARPRCAQSVGSM